MDTSKLATTAEDYVSSQLQHHDLIIAKPKPDLRGTDLLAFAEMDDGVKFCRVQCKGRSLKSSNSTQICIPKKYVSNGFLVVLYLVVEDDQHLYVFFPNDIRKWHENENSEFQLSLSRSNFRDKLEHFQFDASKASLVKSLIQSAEVSGEFRNLIQGRISVKLEAFGTLRNATP